MKHRRLAWNVGGYQLVIRQFNTVDDSQDGLKRTGTRSQRQPVHGILGTYEARVPSENADDEEDGHGVCRLEGHHVLVNERHACCR